MVGINWEQKLVMFGTHIQDFSYGLLVIIQAGHTSGEKVKGMAYVAFLFVLLNPLHYICQRGAIVDQFFPHYETTMATAMRED